MSEFKWDDELVKEFVRRKVLIYTGNWPHDNVDKFINDFKDSKQPKPEWEIVAYISSTTTTVYYKNSIGEYISKAGEGYPVGVIPSHLNIHSVKRLSDGEVFTVGDLVEIKQETTSPTRWDYFHIEHLFINQNMPSEIRVSSSEGMGWNWPFSTIQKAKAKPIPVMLTPPEVEKLKQILNTHD
jgi:hypothetical protein